MKLLYTLLLLPFLTYSCGSETDNDQANQNTETEVEETETIEDNTTNERKSPRIQKSVQENGMAIAFDYGSPRVKDREIWGKLVPYDKVWRAGADEVSAVTFDNDVMVGDSLVEAGTYGMFIIPKENDDWVFILNEEWSQEKHDVWGAFDYKQDKDAVRLNVPTDHVKAFHEELSYDYDPKGQYIVFEWEYIHLQIPVTPIEPA